MMQCFTVGQLRHANCKFMFPEQAPLPYLTGLFLLVILVLLGLISVRCLMASDAQLRHGGADQAAGRVKCRLFHTRV
jgi:hypothetical protein